jgi:Zn-dependent metalloprotease
MDRSQTAIDPDACTSGSRWQVLLLSVAGAAAALILSGCNSRSLGPGGPAHVLTASTAWQRTVDAQTYHSRLGALTEAINRLRQETASGWTGRQDDVTGWLTELRGGRFTAGGVSTPQGQATAFLLAYGTDLFGVPPNEIRFTSSEGPGANDQAAATTLRAEQRVGDVPVLDAQLIVSVASSSDTLRVQSVSGRVFPGIEGISTTPVVVAGAAVQTAVQVSGGEATHVSRLVILPQGVSGALCWEVPVAGGSLSPGASSLYYVDAVRGQVLTVRAGTADADILYPSFGGSAGVSAKSARTSLGSVAAAVVQGTPVEVTGNGPDGKPLTANGLRTPEGTVVLVDTTTPNYNSASGAGTVETHDATGLHQDQQSRLPGPLSTFPGTQSGDPEALAAQTYARYVVDYFRSHFGRNSWDGKGGTLISSVHFGGSSLCNAFFSPGADPPQMAYGDGCVIDGQRVTSTMVGMDVAAHEMTHGVTATSVGNGGIGLIYDGQSGALNEATSDYFGEVVGDAFDGEDDASVGEGLCVGITPPTAFCQPFPDGSVGLRYMLNGATLADYLYVLDPPLVFLPLRLGQDHGGVHSNSFIWNNALWSIRERLARLDGTTMLESPRAQLFDRIVYGALTRHFTASEDYVGARAAVEAAASEEGADPVIRRAIADQFDFDHICAGCVTPSPQAGVVAQQAGAEIDPAVSDDRVAWLDTAGSGGGFGALDLLIGGQGQTVASGGVVSVGFAGPNALITLETVQGGAVLRHDLSSGTSTILDAHGDLGLAVAGSDQGGAWVNLTDHTLDFVDPNGAVTSGPLPAGLQGLDLVSIGTGGRTVVASFAGTSKVSTVVSWQVGSAPKVLYRGKGLVVSVGAFGSHAYLADRGTPGDGISDGLLFDVASGQSTPLSSHGSFLGAAVSADYVVWTEEVGTLSGSIALAEAQAGYSIPDTDLFLYSLKTSQRYSLGNRRGQQGLPAISGNQLVWQDAGNGSDDVYSATLPPNL